MRKALVGVIVGLFAFAATGCVMDSGATFIADGSVVIGLKFLFPKTLINGSSRGSVSGFSPSEIAAGNARLQKKFPGARVTALIQGDESGALVTIPFKTEKEAFAFLTRPSKLNQARSIGSKTNLDLSDTGGMFASASHTRSGDVDTYRFQTAPAVQPSPSQGSQPVLTNDQLASIFAVTFAITVPRPITSAPGALFSQDRKTAIWKLSWLHSETLTATAGGPDPGLVANVTGPLDGRLIIAVAFIAIAVGFVLGMFLAWRLLVPRTQGSTPPSTPSS